MGPRTTNLRYSITGLDNVRQRFTGYEKDEETDLDFAEARMYENKHGRFTAVDPLLASASAGDPQTFNRYNYTGNNPINYTDPSGLKWCRNGASGATRFTSQGVACESGWDDVDNSLLEVSRGNFTRESTNGRAGVGSIILMNPNGSVTVQQASPEIQALAQGKSIQESVEVTDNSAGSIAGSGASSIPMDGGTISSNVVPRGMLSLPCRVEGGCGSEPIYSNPLSNGASADELLDATQYTLEAIGMIPGAQIADAASGIISLFRGDRTGALLSAGALFPIGGQVFTGAKWARRGPSLDPDAPHNRAIREVASQIKDGNIIAGGGELPEKLIPTVGGFKSGRRPDILVQRADRSKYGINIGRQTKKGLPYKRESEALWDLEGAGIEMFFVPYNR